MLSFNLLILRNQSIVTQQNQQGGTGEAFERIGAYARESNLVDYIGCGAGNNDPAEDEKDVVPMCL
jgi:hypothetical protein